MELNIVYNCDCVDGMNQLDNNSVDLVVTSPPYDSIRSYDGFCFDYMKTAEQLFRVVKDGGVVIWVVSDQTIDGSETGSSFRQALCFMDTGFRLHDTMIYKKKNYIPLTHNRYEQCFEYMFCFSKGKPKTFNPIMIDCLNAGKVESYGVSRRRKIDDNQAMRSCEETTYKATKSQKIHPNIFEYTVGSEKTGHPAPFPNDLAKDMIMSFSNEGDVVLDPFMGSGTTAYECILHKRNYIGFEISSTYCEIINIRIHKANEEMSSHLF